MITIHFLIAVLITSSATFFAYKNRYKTKKCITCILSGIFFSSVFMLLPTEWIKEGQNVSSPFLYRFLSSLIVSIKILAGNPDLLQIERIALSGWQRIVYIAINYIYYIIAPFLTSSLILSFIGDTLDKIRYFLTFSKKICVFSELNKNSVTLAESIVNENKMSTVVFCNTKNVNNDMTERARKLGGIMLYNDCYALLPFRKRMSSYELYLISENKDKNVRDAEAAIKCKHEMSGIQFKTIAFTQDNISISNLESLLNNKDNKLEETQSDNSELFKMVFVDELTLFCNSLVYDYPLYFELMNPDYASINEKSDLISVIIAGCGEWGMHMLKTVLYNGQIPDIKLKIRVYDKQASHQEQLFFAKCPQIAKLLQEKDSGVDLRFVDTDAWTDDFYTKIEEEKNTDANYVCIATDDDRLNIDLAERLYRFLRIKNNFKYTPPIFARVKNDEITNKMTGNNKTYLDERRIMLFGTASSFYSETTLFNTRLELLALGVQLIYDSDKTGETLLSKCNRRSDKYIKAINSFYNSEYSRRSSMAAALHIGTKIFHCLKSHKYIVTDENGKTMSVEKAMENKEIREKLLQIYREFIDEAKGNKDGMRAVMKNEHDRWNFFMATEGYRSSTIDDIKAYYPISDKHKDELSKSHPCIIPFDELDELTSSYNKQFNADKDFVNEDKKLIQNLPEIVEFAFA